MNSNETPNSFTTYINGIKIFLSISIALLFLFGIIAELVYPDERDKLSTNCRTFEAEWSQVHSDGSKTPIEVPGKVEAEYGELVTITTTIPEDIIPGECLAFRPIWQDVTIYIDGELCVEYTTKNSRPFGTNSPMRYLLVELDANDAGKELTYQCTSKSKYSGDFRVVLIGDRMSVWTYLLRDSGARMIISIFLLLLSIFCILVCIILKFVYKKNLDLHYLAWTLFFCAFWMLSETALRQLIVKNISILSYYAYWSLMIIPIPLIIYINEIQDKRYRKLFVFALTYSTILLITSTILQVFDIAQFVEVLPLIHTGLIIAIVFMIVTITIDTIKKKIKDYLFVGIGLYGMLFTAIIEILMYYIGTDLSLGTVLAVGLLFLLITAIIKTGQDLFKTEKNRQQAISAREAQAKFLANMSHEIRTPINAIIGMNEMILRENEDDVIEGYANNIQSASNMLLGLINDVLDFSKIESGQLELVEENYQLDALLQHEILLLNTRAANKPISTMIDIDSSLPSILYGDELRIKQILTNLISNAVKYTEQGTITIKAYANLINNDNIELVFSVIDTGIGIKSEELPKLFDSFKRLELSKNRNIQGTGLGLNIAKQLIDLMHGKISVESVYGKGSTFTVKIPQKIIDRHPIGKFNSISSKTKKTTDLKTKHFTAPQANILVVDDNSMNLALMRGLLKRTKMNVDLADCGEKALELTMNKKYDIIFMDHMMPELDGIEALEILRNQDNNPNQNSIVIVLTANTVNGCKEMYLDSGFNDYFPKPVQADKLDELLKNYLPVELIIYTDDNNITTKSDSSLTPTTNTNDLQYIDQQLGIHHCIDSKDFYIDMLKECTKLLENYLPQLDTCYSEKDWKNYAIITHSIKSSAINIGATNFSELSLKHEFAGKDADENFITSEYVTYIEGIRNLIKEIEIIINCA